MAVLIAAAVAFGAATKMQGKSYGTVQLPAATPNTFSNFYGTTATNVEAYFAPNYGRVAAAERLRDSFLDDLQQATAVYSLPRAGRSTIRPMSLAVSNASFDARIVSTPQGFINLLNDSGITNAGTVFTAYRGAAAQQNLSIFVMGKSSSLTNYIVRAVYELDFVATTSPVGTYASVRRYDNYPTSLSPTDYYDVFYPQPDGTRLPYHTAAFLPTTVFFENASRAGTSEGSPTDLFKLAEGRSFFFIWWPDPSSPYLESVPVGGSAYSSGDPRYYYREMGDRTSFFMVVPMFPPL